MILGDNPTGHGFVVRDLVLIELSGHAPPPPPSLGERGKAGIKNFRKNLAGAGVRNFNFGGGGGGGSWGGGGGGGREFKIKIKTAKYQQK